MKLAFAIIVVVLRLGLAAAEAPAVTINWAGNASSSSVADAGNALGQPDGVLVGGYDDGNADVDSAAYAGFGSGDNVSYSDPGLAALLGISPGVLAQADFIGIELNGSLGGVETSSWLFTDGGSSLTVNRTFNTGASGAVIAEGTISSAAYGAFFGFAALPDVFFSYLLFDIDGASAVDPFVAGFTATVSATGPGDPSTPDLDVVGRIGPDPAQVPGPATGLLVSAATLVLLGRIRGRRPAGALSRGF